MIDKEIKREIIKALKPLNPQKIILFGSYAYGKPNEDSDIDLFIINNKNIESEALMNLRRVMQKHDISFDILCDSYSNIKNKKDYFYQTDILKKGKILYAK